MVILSNNDMFEVRISTLLADYDRDSLTNLYQPIIGYTALAIYFTLWSEANNQKVLSFSTHEQLLLRMKMAPGHFVEARKILEAVGLLKTKLEKAPGVAIYHYELSAPKTPKEFFKDTLLYGMLIQSIGENDANRLKRVYEASSKEQEGEDISSSFNEVFHPDFENESFLKAAKDSTTQTLGRNKSKIDTEFNYEIFFKYLSSISQIKDTAINKKEMKEVERLSSLYGVNEKEAAYVVANNYDPSKEKGKRLDLEQINKDLMNDASYSFISKKTKNQLSGKVSGDSAIAEKINLFEKTSPRQILSILQNGTKPASSDLRIIDTLSKDFNLPNGVINVIIDFVLNQNQNVLSRSYAEKIAASFNRENIQTTLDAMNYCNSIIEKGSKKKNKVEKTINNEIKTSKIEKRKVSKEEWDALFDDNKEKDDAKNDSELPF